MSKLLKELLEKRDALCSDLESLTKAVEAEGRDLNSDEEKRSRKLLRKLDELDGRIAEEQRSAARQRMLAEARSFVQTQDGTTTATVAVQSEPRVYGEDSPHSWWADQIAVQIRSPLDAVRQTAEGRLMEWSHQVEREIAHGTKEGRRAEAQVRERYREDGLSRQMIMEARERGRASLESKAEQRAITTGGGTTVSAAGGGGAAFVTPVILIADYAPWREFGRAFADQCHKEPLPDYGMEVYIPQVTGRAGVATQTEGTAPAEVDPTFGFISGGLITKEGNVTVTQQQVDRTGPGFSFDRMVFDQLNRDYAPQLDSYVLSQALANAQSQVWAGNAGTFVLNAASGAGGFYGQVSKAKASIRTTAGTVMNPTHLFLVPTRYEYIAAWADAQGRALVVPDYAGPFNALGNAGNGDAGIEGATGTRFNGLPVFHDANIPTPATGADQAIVGALDEVWLFEGPPVHRVLPQTVGQNLQIILQLYRYVVALVRYPSAIVSISGTGMSAIGYTN